ncbi:MAG: MoaD/ThiS family protein [Proteobacteria bacterium]|nr:MoaD/ThiS family protein [Pseudomonadota bacterium]MBU1582633.1 MoaD/ThiS family protein [Pseudomonadota bacterium]MBU2453129.1 MoaD/ThiS family protein [Pseudomonadota bacterium]MBU2630688.1 MoaD/ThiS family protein [Pseudomonadota bacterium]
MSIKIHIHVTHRRHTNGQETIETQGTCVGEALHNFVAQYPGMKNELFDKKGALRHYIEIYLNKESAYPGELEKQLKDGDEIQIITFLAGG